MKQTTWLILAAIAALAMPLSVRADYYSSVVLSDNPMAYWQFEETSMSSAAADSSGNGYDATYTGNVGLTAQGISGKAATFSNLYDSFVALPGTWGGSATPDMSFELWFNTSSPTHSQVMLGNSRADYGPLDDAVFFQLSNSNTATDTSRVIVAAYDQEVPAKCSTDYWSASMSNFAINEWHHFVYTVEASTGNTKAYVDGVLSSGLSFGTFGGNYQYLSPGALQIGQARENWDYHFIGDIDEVAIYDTALSDAQILEHYQAATQAPPTQQNQAFDVPEIAAVTIDGNLGDWSDSTAWSEEFVEWNTPEGATPMDSVTKAKFAWNDAGDTLYVAIQTNQALGGHAVVGVGTAVDSTPYLGANATQLAFDAGTGNTVDIMNEIAEYGLGTDGTDGVVAAQTNDGTTWTYEIAIPYWKDWTTMTEKQTISADDEYFVYLVMEDEFGGGLGTDMTYEGNPGFAVNGFEKGSTLTFKASEKIAGDANRDGKVDGSDVTILAGNWQYGVTGGGATWAMGDFNGDGKVDGSDVTILAGNWQYGVMSTAAAVPEPGTLLLLLSAVGSLLIWKRVR